MGDDAFGESLIRSLHEKGVDTDLLESVAGQLTGAAFITVTPDGENAITVASGANHALSPQDVDAASEAIRAAKVLVAQMEIRLQTVLHAAEVADAAGTRVVLNLAPPLGVPATLLRKLNPLVVNKHEASFLLKKEVEGIGGALAAASEFLSWGTRSVVVTLGALGAVVADGNTNVHLPAPKVNVADTTGAGDAFVGALAVKLAQNAPLEEAVAYAVHAGTAAVTKEGAQNSLPTPEIVKPLQNEVIRNPLEQ